MSAPAATRVDSLARLIVAVTIGSIADGRCIQYGNA